MKTKYNLYSVSNQDCLLKLLTCSIIILSSLICSKTEGIKLMLLSIVFCFVFIPVMNFKMFQGRFNKFLLIVEYTIVSSIAILINQILVINYKMNIIITCLYIALSLVFSYFLNFKYKKANSVFGDIERRKIFIYNLMFSIISFIGIFVNLEISSMISLSLICAQLYFYLSSNKRTFLIKRV